MVYARHGACSQGELRAHGLDAELRPWLEVETGRRKKTMERVRAGLRLDGHPMRRSQCHGRRPPPPGHRPHRQRATGHARGLQGLQILSLRDNARYGRPAASRGRWQRLCRGGAGEAVRSRGGAEWNGLGWALGLDKRGSGRTWRARADVDSNGTDVLEST